MDIGAILVGIGLLVLVVAYVARPLFEKHPDGSRAVDAGSHGELAARRDAIYALIRELDADYQTGAVNAEDHQALRARYVGEGVAVLKQLDALSGEDERAALEAEIEAQVLALRQGPAKRQMSKKQRPVERQEPATARASAGPSAPRFCTQCGHPADPEDRFCAECGAALKGTASP
jgi:hypothetical protein